MTKQKDETLESATKPLPTADAAPVNEDANQSDLGVATLAAQDRATGGADDLGAAKSKEEGSQSSGASANEAATLMKNLSTSAPAESNPPAPLVKDGDIRTLVFVGLTGILIMLIFGAALAQSGLLSFPDLTKPTTMTDYAVDSLVYRERRMALGLILRTFITSFSFVVGLALCTMGGLFILRQVTSLTTISASLGEQGPEAMRGLISGKTAEGEDADAVAEGLRRTQFAFSAYSPGIVFMLGGVLIMGLTQWLAIPIRAVEVFPAGMIPYCQSDETTAHEECPEAINAAAGTGQATIAGPQVVGVDATVPELTAPTISP